MTDNPFRSPINNQRYLKGLFFETTDADKSTVLYTLKDRDHEGFPSLYRLFLEMDDPTEYEFANKYLDGWEHWQMLCGCKWFAPFVERWREELKLREAARIIPKIRDEAAAGNRNALQALKYLLERGWEDKKAQVKGKRLQKAEELEAHRQISEDTNVKEAAERLGIKLVR